MISRGANLPSLWPVALAALVLYCLVGAPPSAKDWQGSKAESFRRGPRIIPSTLLENVAREKKERPNITPKQLAEYANAMLAQKGFNYDFDACDILKASGKPAEGDRLPSMLPETYPYKMEQTDGREINFRIVSMDYGAPCGECFFSIPALQVTKRRMKVLAGSRVYHLKRPEAFFLDEAELVDSSMRKALRTWQLPFQTIPVGISPDGSKLYVPFHTEYALDDLVLELSEDGSVRVRAWGNDKGEWIENHPKDPNNEYLSFMRFRAGERSYIVKFTAPCT
jgi:hypothetical protein